MFVSSHIQVLRDNNEIMEAIFSYGGVLMAFRKFLSETLLFEHMVTAGN